MKGKTIGVVNPIGGVEKAYSVASNKTSDEAIRNNAYDNIGQETEDGSDPSLKSPAFYVM